MGLAISARRSKGFTCTRLCGRNMGVSENRGTLFWGPYNKDPTIEGTILGSPIVGNSHIYIYIWPNAWSVVDMSGRYCHNMPEAR